MGPGFLNILKINLGLLLSAGIVGCAGKPYRPEFCDIINVDKLNCKPTDEGKKSYDISTIEGLGYRCVSPKDWAEGKKRLRYFLELDDTLFNEDYVEIFGEPEK